MTCRSLFVSSVALIASGAASVSAAPIYESGAAAKAGIFIAASSCSDAVSCSNSEFSNDGPSEGSGFGDANPVYASRASASALGTALGQGSGGFLETFTNSSGITNDYYLNFVVMGGFVTADAGPNGGTASGKVVSSLKVNGITVFGLDIEFNELGIADANGADDDGLLNGYTEEADRIFWAPTAFTVLLGTFADGQSFDVAYTIAASTVSTEPLLPDFCIAADGIEILNGTCATGRAVAADPGNLIGQGLSAVPNSTTPGNTVPEPASLALLSAGLAGLAAARRRRRA